MGGTKRGAIAPGGFWAKGGRVSWAEDARDNAANGSEPAELSLMILLDQYMPLRAISAPCRSLSSWVRPATWSTSISP